jgi:hypothetical protein
MGFSKTKLEGGWNHRMRTCLIFRAKGGFYSAVSIGKNAASIDGVPEATDMPVKRIGSLTIVFTGTPAVVEAISKQIDFSSLAENPLNEFALFKGFYLPLARLIENGGLVEKEADGTVSDFGCQALFVSGDVAFSFGNNGFVCVQDMAAIGDGAEKAVDCLMAVHTGMNPQDEVNKAIVASCDSLGIAAFPLLIPDFDTGYAAFLQKNGASTEISIPLFSEKNQDGSILADPKAAKA